MVTYLDILQKIQNQTLDNIKQIQAVQISTLSTVRDLITDLPTTKGMPTLAQITEFGTSFATKLLDQQKEFATQLADAVKPSEANSLVKSSAN